MAVNSVGSAVSLELGSVSILLPEESVIYLIIMRMKIIIPISKVCCKDYMR